MSRTQGLVIWIILLVGAVFLGKLFLLVKQPNNKIAYPDIAIEFDFSKNERRYKKSQGGKISMKYFTKRKTK